MKRIVIRVNDETAESLQELAARCSEADRRREGFTSHGALRIKALLGMLAEDAAMVVTRPGSWEGANMSAVLASHGYEV